LTAGMSVIQTAATSAGDLVHNWAANSDGLRADSREDQKAALTDCVTVVWWAFLKADLMAAETAAYLAVRLVLQKADMKVCWMADMKGAQKAEWMGEWRVVWSGFQKVDLMAAWTAVHLAVC
jgi:hypothetical protein